MQFSVFFFVGVCWQLLCPFIYCKGAISQLLNNIFPVNHSERHRVFAMFEGQLGLI